MAMLIIGLLMIVFGIYVYTLGYGNIGFLITFIPATLFVVGGLILTAHGIKSMNDDEKKGKKQENQKEVGQNDLSESSRNQAVMQIREYKKLAEEGIITEEEFEEKKKQLLQLRDSSQQHEA